jgi:putative tryptophan/tyrosine transport system substrate-binding protein
MVLLALSLIGAALAGKAQPAGKVWRIGFFAVGSRDVIDTEGGVPAAFRQGLQQRGYIEGQNTVIEYRWELGAHDRIPTSAAELARLNLDLIFAFGDKAIAATKRLTSTIPIVMQGCDALAAGLITNLARPGGNLTGVTCLMAEMASKRLELLKDIVGSELYAAVLYDVADPNKLPELRGIENAAESLRVRLKVLPIRDPASLETMLQAARKNGVNALVVMTSNVLSAKRQAILDFVARTRLPAVYPYRSYVDAGGLFSYGANLPAMAWQATAYVDKILKGEKPGDLPVEQPTKYELVLNLKTVKALSLTIPPYTPTGPES